MLPHDAFRQVVRKTMRMLGKLTARDRATLSWRDLFQASFFFFKAIQDTRLHQTPKFPNFLAICPSKVFANANTPIDEREERRLLPSELPSYKDQWGPIQTILMERFTAFAVKSHFPILITFFVGVYFSCQERQPAVLAHSASCCRLKPSKQQQKAVLMRF